MKVRYSLLWVCLVVARFAAPDLTWAQANIRPNEQRLDANACLAELKSQPNIWVMEVYLKPLRMITVNVTDPKSGQVRKETFHYIVYRATNRFISRDADANAPRNELDPLALPDMFVPEFELVTIDDPDPTQETESFPDEICGNVPLKLWKVGPKGNVVKLKDIVLPEVVSEINQRERFQNAPLQLKNSVEISQPVPPAAKRNTPEERFLNGVAVFRGVPASADRMQVFIKGFSNGFRKSIDADGQEVILTKTGIQLFVRQGDEFDPREGDIRVFSEPVWAYR